MNITTYLREIQKELKLTTFPSQNTVINFTIFVIVFTAAMAMYLGALDLGFGEAVLQGINNVKIPAEVASTTLEIATSTASGTVDISPLSATSVPANILVK